VVDLNPDGDGAEYWSSGLIDWRWKIKAGSRNVSLKQPLTGTIPPSLLVFFIMGE
jgi:hypothetical protein